MAEHKHGTDTALSVVNHLVANQGVLYVKLHQYHWHVKGPHFFTLHEKFEELYNETTEYLDAFAERLIALGEKPYSTLTEYLEYASIKEERYEEALSAEQMVQNLVADFRTIKDLTAKGIDLAGEEGDAVTEDMLIAYQENLDVQIWMLQAYLGKDAREGESK